ncbi:MAG: hypothetical protein JNK02_02705, partial [Planctomycetes bacterium]|nr:hypothetical protein [Planctomycetota bacterium]
MARRGTQRGSPDRGGPGRGDRGSRDTQARDADPRGNELRSAGPAALDAIGTDATLAPADIALLFALRDGYVARSEGGLSGPLERTWSSARELALYDATFGARIGWKWRAVLAELSLRAITPPRGTILDWGSGTGVASRAWIDALGAQGQRVLLHDHSAASRAFAAHALRARHPALEVVELEAPPAEPVDVLLASHVISELEDRDFDRLVDLGTRARFVVWVEPGAKPLARRLVEARERLRTALAVLAPCTHHAACPLAAPERARDWCHHLAAPPPEAFTTRLWNQVARELGIDLRSLPYSFLVLGRGPERDHGPDAARILGRPRVEKGRALLDVCSAEGVRVLRFLERLDKGAFRAFERAPQSPRLHRLRAEALRVTACEPLPVPAP